MAARRRLVIGGRDLVEQEDLASSPGAAARERLGIGELVDPRATSVKDGRWSLNAEIGDEEGTGVVSVGESPIVFEREPCWRRGSTSTVGTCPPTLPSRLKATRFMAAPPPESAVSNDAGERRRALAGARDLAAVFSSSAVFAADRVVFLRCCDARRSLRCPCECDLS